MRISDWSSDVCSSDLVDPVVTAPAGWAFGPADTATTTTVPCTIDTLAAGATQSFSLAVTATAAQSGTTLGLAAAVQSRAPAPVEGNHSAPAPQADTLPPQPNLSRSITGPATPPPQPSPAAT